MQTELLHASSPAPGPMMAAPTQRTATGTEQPQPPLQVAAPSAPKATIHAVRVLACDGTGQIADIIASRATDIFRAVVVDLSPGLRQRA